jgi:tetratricopeptide (TPR) repeat protein
LIRLDKYAFMNRIFFVFITLSVIFAAGSCRSKTDYTPIDEEGLPDTIIQITRLIEARPTDASLYAIRAGLFLEYRMPERAMYDIERAIDINPNVASFYVTKADIFFSRGRASESIIWLKKAREIDPGNVTPPLKLGEVFMFISDFKTSIQYLDTAAKLDDLRSDPWLIGGFVMLYAGDTLAAIRYFNECLKRDQNNFKANLQLAIVYTLKLNALALEYYRNALDINPQSAEVYYNKGKYHQDMGQFNEAMDAYLEVTRMTNDMGFADNAFFNLGYIHVEMGIWDEARDYFGHAIHRNPNYFQAYYAKGYTHEMLGDLLNARGYYDKAIDLNPNYEVAREAMHRLIGKMRAQ